MARRCIVWGLTFLLAALGATSVQGRERITIVTHWGPGQAQYNALMQYADEYMALHPEVEIEIIGTGTITATMVEQVLVMIAGGSMPEAVHLSSRVLPDLADYLLPLPEDVADAVRETYLPVALELAKVNGNLIGFPTEFQTAAIMYNVRFFEESGLEYPPVFQTWDHYLDTARKLTRRDAANNVTRFGTTHDSWRLMYDARAYVNTNGGEILSPDGQAQLNSPLMVVAVEKLRQAYQEGILAIGPERFAGQTAAMLPMEPWYAGSVRAANPDLYSDGMFRASSLPKGDNGQPPHVMTYGYTWSVLKGADNVGAALDFLQWLTMAETERGTTRMGDVLATLGSLPGTYLDLANQPASREALILDYMQATGAYVHMSIVPQGPGTIAGAGEWLNVLSGYMVPMVNGSISVVQGLEDANAAYAARLMDAARAQR